VFLQVVKNRGHPSGDIELVGYLQKVVGTVPLVLDLHITHERKGSTTDPTLDGQLHYPNDLDKTLNETETDWGLGVGFHTVLVMNLLVNHQ
jgi:hypothetical protein